MLVACGTKPQPKAWVSMEKPPMRVIIIDNERDIDPGTIDMMFKHMAKIPYRKTEFNDDTTIGIHYDTDIHKHESNIQEIKVGN